MSTPSVPLSPRKPWIVSAWWDMSYVVLTPLAIVPVVLILARHWLSAEQVSLAVISFASLGHHLPGFMRAYGDRELFLRFRWRFLLVPPLVFALALLFSPPTAIANALSLPWRHLHGLELILLVWGTWHGLMQTYGFMRIYDVKQGLDDAWTARLDHWLCVAIFVAGVVFSDARVFGIANSMWQSGLPLFGPEWLYGIRALVAAAGGIVLVLYAINLLNRRKMGQPQSLVKLLLAGITGWFYWYTGRLSTNLLIGLAMFEIYHAVQYYAIVWIYNRRLFERTHSRFGPLGFLFRDSRTMLCVYLAAIAAYGAIRLIASEANESVYQTGAQDAYQWLMAWFVASSFLHFYFDGFIWKVSEQKTQENLVDEVSQQSPAVHYVSAISHVSKWALLFIIAGGLLFSEWRNRDRWNSLSTEQVAALAALTPSLPECQEILCQQALAEGDPQTASEHARQALAMRPRSHALHASLGMALGDTGKIPEALEELNTAIEIAPHRGSYHAELAVLLSRQGKLEQAEAEFRLAVDLEPEDQAVRQQLIRFYLSQGRTREAQAEFNNLDDSGSQSTLSDINRVLLLSQLGKHAEATRLATLLQAGNRDNWQINLVLGTALNSSGDHQGAMLPLLKATRGNRNSPEIYYQLGLACFQAGDFQNAVVFLGKAVKLAPHHFRAALQLANTYYVSNRPELALAAYRSAERLDPTNQELCGNQGGLLMQLGQLAEARAVYLRGLEAHPDSATLNYNLGLLHLRTDEPGEARRRILRAGELGIVVPPEVRAAIDGN